MRLRPVMFQLFGSRLSNVPIHFSKDRRTLNNVIKAPIAACTCHGDSGTEPPVHQDQLGQLQTVDPSLGKAAARKAKRQPPTLIPPGTSDKFSTLQELLGNGALLIDKPQEWTSFDVCGKLRGTLKSWKIKKVGHAGTLDPMATGLLVVCTGAGTKFVDDYQAMEKEYSGVLRLGEGTPSYDSEMEVDERLPWEHITDEDLSLVARRFEGDILQLPPMYSAIKVKGQKLYNLARDGQTIEREERPVSIMSLQLWRSSDSSEVGRQGASQPSVSGHTVCASQEAQDWGGVTEGQILQGGGDAPSTDTSGSQYTSEEGYREGGGRGFCLQGGSSVGPHRSRQDVFFRVRCSKGTYIRSLVYDIGRALGSVAYMASLRRDGIGSFHVRDAWQLQDLVQRLKTLRNDVRDLKEDVHPV